ncbi:hypothetical protein H4582DRAFT_2004570 [Lactarius indigo]|nr:hypothetical protein H4582DRAFT_2004570 [Lactarius indigo]
MFLLPRPPFLPPLSPLPFLLSSTTYHHATSLPVRIVPLLLHRGKDVPPALGLHHLQTLRNVSPNPLSSRPPPAPPSLTTPSFPETMTTSLTPVLPLCLVRLSPFLSRFIHPFSGAPDAGKHPAPSSPGISSFPRPLAPINDFLPFPLLSRFVENKPPAKKQARRRANDSQPLDPGSSRDSSRPSTTQSKKSSKTRPKPGPSRLMPLSDDAYETAL